MISYGECVALIDMASEVDAFLMVVLFVVGLIGGWVLKPTEVIVHISRK